MNYFNDIHVEISGTKKYLVYPITAEEKLNELSFGMLNFNAAIPGLLPAQGVNENGVIKSIWYDISSKHTVRTEFSGTLTFEMIHHVFSGIIDALISADEYLIDLNSIILDIGSIFVNPATNQIEMLCIPVETNPNTDFQQNLAIFLKSILLNISVNNVATSASWLGTIIAFIGNPSHTLQEYKQMLDNLKNTEPAPHHNSVPENEKNQNAGVGDFGPNYYNSGAIPPIPSDSRFEPAVQADSVSNSPAENGDSDDAPEKKGFLNSIFHFSKPKKNTHQDCGFAVPGHDSAESEPVVPKPEKSEKPSIIKKKPAPKAMIQPYLIRCRNNEQIRITKSGFTIGKNLATDYPIQDNPTISHEHIQFLIQDDQVFVLDEKSTNHSYINGMYVTKNVKTPISDGSNLRLSNEDFEFHLR